MHMRYVFIIIK